MKLRLTHIGPIREIEFDINADLTFVYGKNNIGKSYAITIMYLILKNYVFGFSSTNRFNLAYDYWPVPHFDKIHGHDKIISHFETSNEDLDITQIVKDNFSRFLTIIFVKNFEESLKSSFGDITNLNNKITNTNLSINLKFDTFEFAITESNNELSVENIKLDSPCVCKKSQQHRKPRTTSKHLTFYYNSPQQFDADLQEYLASKFRESIIEIFKNIRQVYYLPASRSGLYRALNAFSQILVELSRKRSFLRQKVVLPSISEQDSDYFSKINEINLKRVNQKFHPAAKTIENKLLKGEVIFDQQTKQILFKPNNSNIRLELLATSSMIAEVSPIVLYLKYIISSDDAVRRKKEFDSTPIIFIEEPEAHLHPEAQLILMECFVELVNLGAKLVITSHSNYMFSKLNNLISAKRIDSSKVSGYQFINTDTGSIYEKLPISELGMEDQNFVDTSELLYAEKLEIIESMNPND